MKQSMKNTFEVSSLHLVPYKHSYRLVTKVACVPSIREAYTRLCVKGQIDGRKSCTTNSKPPKFVSALSGYFTPDNLKSLKQGKLLITALDKISVLLTLKGLCSAEKNQLTSLYENRNDRSNLIIFDLAMSMLAKWMIIYSYRPEIVSASSKSRSSSVYNELFSIYLEIVRERLHETSVSTWGRLALILMLNSARLTAEGRDSFVKKLSALMQEKATQPFEDFFLDVGVVPTLQCDTVEAQSQLLLLVCSSNILAATYSATAAQIMGSILQNLSTESDASKTKMSSAILLTAITTYARVYRFDRHRLEIIHTHADVFKSLIAGLNTSLLEENEDFSFIEKLLCIPFLFRSISCIIGHRQLSFLGCKRENLEADLRNLLEYLPYLSNMGLQQLLKTGWFPVETLKPQFFAIITKQIYRFNAETFTHFLLCSLRLRVRQIPNEHFQDFTERVSTVQSEITPLHLADALIALLQLEGVSDETHLYFMNRVEQTKNPGSDITTIVKLLLSIELRRHGKENKQFIQFLLTHLINNQQKFQNWLNSKHGELSKAELGRFLKASDTPEAIQLLELFTAT
ncbi:T-complex protein 1 subunit alpha [Perkinsela sp. CCAP 1560/4]|nr:T-complex protein 1 subunit alpha [Perkinsela sp. CCAP 1560/4]|eukprot:KNH03644.1 T-complex protein 1 subunit alpha [Perkinsela sp. CCAP 1560/4]